MHRRIVLLLAVLLVGILSVGVPGVARRVAAQTSPTITSNLQCGPAPVVAGQVVTCWVLVDGIVGNVMFSYDPASNVSADTTPLLGAYGQNVVFQQPGNYLVAVFVCNDVVDEADLSINTPGCAINTTVVDVVASGCPQWDVTGTWQVSQANDYYPVFVLQQDGTTVTRAAVVSEAERARGGYTSRYGTVSGTVVGDFFDVIVAWPLRSGVLRGRYYGTVTQGAMNGLAENPDLASYRGLVWSATGTATCVSR